MIQTNLFVHSTFPNSSLRRPLGRAVLLAALTLPSMAAAQTAVTTIENAGGDPVLTVFEDGALLTPGTFGTGAIPAQGAGTRLMWYPAKAALRAGHVVGSEWDDTNVGDYSVAFGLNSRASGFRATAFGGNTTASGNSSTAMGVFTTASGDFSTAMGRTTTASGDRSTAMGFESTASDDYATAMGRTTTASGFASTAIGRFTIASGLVSTAMGDDTTASGNNSTAMGADTTASGPLSTAMGWRTTASGNSSTAMGRTTTASGDFSTAMGWETTASGRASTVIGEQTTASGFASTAMGSETTASGRASTAMGVETVSATGDSLSIGRLNRANTTDDGTLFVVGNGAFNFRSDALVLDGDGNLTIAGTLTESSDRRLKTAIEPLHDVLARLESIQPVRFEFKNQRTHPQGEQIGLVAQEVQKAFPELVHQGSGGYLSVSYTKFTAVLLKGLQQQQAQIDALKAQVAALRAAR